MCRGSTGAAAAPPGPDTGKGETMPESGDTGSVSAGDMRGGVTPCSGSSASLLGQGPGLGSCTSSLVMARLGRARGGCHHAGSTASGRGENLASLTSSDLLRLAAWCQSSCPSSSPPPPPPSSSSSLLLLLLRGSALLRPGPSHWAGGHGFLCWQWRMSLTCHGSCSMLGQCWLLLSRPDCPHTAQVARVTTRSDHAWEGSEGVNKILRWLIYAIFGEGTYLWIYWETFINWNTCMQRSSLLWWVIIANETVHLWRSLQSHVLLNIVFRGISLTPLQGRMFVARASDWTETE